MTPWTRRRPCWSNCCKLSASSCRSVGRSVHRLGRPLWRGPCSDSRCAIDRCRSESLEAPPPSPIGCMALVLARSRIKMRLCPKKTWFLLFHAFKRKIQCEMSKSSRLTTIKWRMIMNTVAFLKPMLSNSTPATLGPMKAPRANVLVHKPLIMP